VSEVAAFQTGKKLAIIVPYRDRAEHIEQFVQHIRGYFARDKIDKQIDCRVIVVEQSKGKAFNRGALKNVGFLFIESETDYVCFHDVDYLPIWADYSWVERPTPILWHGAEYRPAHPGQGKTGVIKHNLELFFGGVLLVPNDQFRQVNGYANDYWGWGPDDSDLQNRFNSASIALGRRKCTFKPLYHDNEAYEVGGGPTRIAKVNESLLKARWKNRFDTSQDGLSNLSFSILNERPIEDPIGERVVPWRHVTVELDGNASPSQRAALKGGASP